jgi:hypothetical protein
LEEIFNIKTIQVTRYITPLREGGSLPAIIEGEDGEKYVMKFKGAGQGTKALIADWIGGEIARKLGFLVPKMAIGFLDVGFGITEPDEEIQDLLKSSVGSNLLISYLTGAITFDANVTKVNEMVASMIVWLDTFITNVDRTVKNTNMLMWQKELWLIDHGAALYFHHNWENWEAHAIKSFPLIKNHVFMPIASKLNEANEIMKAEIDESFISAIVDQLPDEWLEVRGHETFSPNDVRHVYKSYLMSRLSISDQFTKDAINER